MGKLHIIEQYEIADSILRLGTVIAKYGWDNFQFCLESYYSEMDSDIFSKLYSKLKDGESV